MEPSGPLTDTRPPGRAHPIRGAAKSRAGQRPFLFQLMPGRTGLAVTADFRSTPCLQTNQDAKNPNECLRRPCTVLCTVALLSTLKTL